MKGFIKLPDEHPLYKPEAVAALRARMMAYERALIRIANGEDRPIEIAVKVLTGAMP
jgi:hypothetical protein